MAPVWLGSLFLLATTVSSSSCSGDFCELETIVPNISQEPSMPRFYCYCVIERWHVIAFHAFCAHSFMQFSYFIVLIRVTIGNPGVVKGLLFPV
jgi:hypothetical protein